MCFIHFSRLRQVSALTRRGSNTCLIPSNLQARLLYRSAGRTAAFNNRSTIQRILNSASWLVCDLRPRNHVVKSLMNVHWLPVQTYI